MGNAERLRADAWGVCRAALASVDPEICLLRALDEIELPSGKVWVVGMGKASARMAVACEQFFAGRLAGGLVITADGCAVPTERVTVVEAGHPVPDERGMAAAAEIAELAERVGERDVLLVLISGGGSALAPLPAAGLNLVDIRRTADLLLRSGATIQEMNTVRKHLEELKGGGLARRAAAGQVISLILSDVVGDQVESIASGPTAADPSTFQEAWEVLGRYGLTEHVPQPVREHLQEGLAGRVAETVKLGDEALCRVRNVIVGSAATAAAAAAGAAEDLGYRALILASAVQGEAREVGRVCAAVAQELVRWGRPVPPPAMLVLAGETTVTVRGGGKGGRNQELALSASLGMEGLDAALVCALGTDGRDGPTDTAGAMVDGRSAERMRAGGVDPRGALTENDAYPALKASGDLLFTGPTGTNVADLYLIVSGKEER